jgi:PHD/YefM family antitoxin component YafN of YafNO toxin-antitoxin module
VYGHRTLEHPLLERIPAHTRDHIRKLKATGKPAALTVNGQAEVVVQSAKAYQKLLDQQQELLETVQGIRRALDQANRAEVRPRREFLQALAKEHRIELR